MNKIGYAIIKPVKFLPGPWLGLLLAGFCVGNQPAHAAFALSEVAEGIFVHQGQHVGLDDPGRDDIANIGYIEGDECIAVIDTGGSIDIGQQLQDSIRQQSDKPICYVINTHIHFDHVLGNSVFKADDVTFIGHRNLPASLDNNIPFFIEQFPEELGGQPEPGLIVKPHKVVNDTLELDLGNRTIRLTAHPPAHTRTDVSIYDPRTRTLWLSDLLFIERIPVLDGSLKGWLAVMEEIRRIDADTVIPGHGPVSHTPDVALAAQQGYLKTLLTETRAMLAKGAFMEEVIDQVGQQEKLKWKLHEQQHKRNVSNAFIELEWE